MNTRTTLYTIMLIGVYIVSAVGGGIVEQYQDDHIAVFNTAYNTAKTRDQRVELKEDYEAAQACVYSLGEFLVNKGAARTCVPQVKAFYRTVEKITPR